jgi:hypothetical protein
MKATVRVRLVSFLALALTAVVVAASACAKKEPPPPPPAPTAMPTVEVPTPVPAARLDKITVTKSVNADKSPGETAASFGKKDTVYVSFWVADAPAGTELKARWSDPKGKQLTEDKVVTDKAGSGYSEFHAAKKSGWAPGTYKVDLFLNGQPAGTVNFTVS